MKRMLLSATIIMVVFGFLILESCSSGKGAFQHGNYYQAVITSATRLRRNDNHKKSTETLRQAYPLGITFYENQIAGTGGPFKWRSIYQNYIYLQTMHNEIQASPGALKVIPNPKDYSTKLQEARENAAEESYSAGVIALNMGTREKAKEAHVLFKQVNEYVSGYKDVTQKIQDALWAATVKVLVEPLPALARTYDVNAEFFTNRMSEQLRSANVNEYVAFFSPNEIKSRNIQPDHVVRLGFDEFSIGQIYLKETQIPMQRDSLSKEATPVNATSVAAGGNVRVMPTVTPPSNNRITPSQPATPEPATDPQPTDKPTTTPVTQPQSPPSVPVQEPVKTVPVVEQPQKTEPATNPTPVTTPPTLPAAEVKETKPNEPSPVTQPAEEAKPVNSVEEQVVICHIPPGNASNRKAMTIPKSALQGHLNHGDVLGDCEAVDMKLKAEKEKLEKESREKEMREKAERERADKERMEKEKNEREKVEKEKAEKENMEKEKAEKEKLDKEKAEKEKLEKEKMEKEKLEKEKAEKEKAEKEKKKDNKKDNDGYASLNQHYYRLLASSDDNFWFYQLDTSKVVTTYKATVNHFQKTITSNGTLDLKIIDSKTNGVLSQQKIPSEYVWKSEWATYNGDEEALTPEQVKLTKQREMQPPSQQELFKQFTDPLLEKVITKLKEFYSNY